MHVKSMSTNSDILAGEIFDMQEANIEFIGEAIIMGRFL